MRGNAKMNNKIGLCLAFKGTNYGALLQAFATQQIVEKMGFRTEILDYSPRFVQKTVFSPAACLWRLRTLSQKVFLPKRKELELDDLHKENKKQRIIASDAFRKDYIHNIIPLKTYDSLTDQAIQYAGVIVGSDQLWGPNAAFGYFRTLRFVPNGVRRISYATSTGVSAYPRNVWKDAAQFMNAIDFLSVREEAGREIVKTVCGRDAKVVLDPTYLFTKAEWEELIPQEKVVEDGYVFSFFLGDNPKMKSIAKQYAKDRGLRIVAILSNEVCVDDSEYADEVLIGQKPEQFLNLIRNAECVFTDSFHGFAFSVINEKQVYVTYRVRKGTQSRNSRIDNIVEKFGMEDRLIKDPSSLESLDDSETDYDIVNQKLCELRKDSLAFLKAALTFEEEQPTDKYALYDRKADCCGCEACANVCPKGLIEMSADEEGFYYPRITDPKSCVECNACRNVCPVSHADEISSSFTKAYAGWAKKEEDIIASASGGFAASLTDAFLKDGGIVYGAAYTSDYASAEYIRVSSEEEAERLKTSKYFQARKNNVFQQIREDLKTKRVLFTGLPCDVYALKRFIKDDSNLYTLSVICHGPTTEKIHQQYCALLEKKLGSPITFFSARYKKNGNWKPYFIRAVGQNGKEIREQFNRTDYNTAFLYFKRPSCGDCRFKNTHFAADILVGDYHAAAKGNANWNPHGVSSILPLTEKGMKLLHDTYDTFCYNEVPLNTAISQKGVHSSVSKGTDRKAFTEKLNSTGLHEACSIPSVKKDLKRLRAQKRKASVIRSFRGIAKRIIKR